MKFEIDYEVQPGDVIRAHDGQVMLVGDINCVGGVCVHCADISFGEEFELLGNIISQPSKELLDLLKATQHSLNV